MLTTEDRKEIKRIIVETFATSGRFFTGEHQRAHEIDQLDRWLNMAAQIRDLIVNEGFTELTFINPKTGEKRIVEAKLVADSIVDVTLGQLKFSETGRKRCRGSRLLSAR